MQEGDIVLCIDDGKWRKRAYEVFPQLPKKGHYYTIRRIIPNIDVEGGLFGIALVEIRGETAFFLNSQGDFLYEEYHFRSTRFNLTSPPLFMTIKSKKSLVTKILSKLKFKTHV